MIYIDPSSSPDDGSTLRAKVIDWEESVKRFGKVPELT